MSLPDTLVVIVCFAVTLGAVVGTVALVWAFLSDQYSLRSEQRDAASGGPDPLHVPHEGAFETAGPVG